MKELLEILKEYREMLKSGEEAVLATVVRVQGSAYRGPGARMLWSPERGATGFLSGGCLEGDVQEKALEVVESGRPTLVRYDMTSPDDILWGLGMGCDGIVDVLIESLPPGDGPDVVKFLDESIAQRHRSVVAVSYGEGLEIPLGSRLLLRDNGRVLSDWPRGEPRRRVEDHARAVLEEGKGRQVEIEGHPVFLEHVAPPLRLFVVGAGHDAVPLVETASRLGWSVTVIDHRPAFAQERRFPGAERVECLHPREAAEKVRLHAGSAAVVMSHNFPKDVEWLGWLLPSAVDYIGALGPSDRTEKLLQDLREQGQELEEDQLRRLYGPVGLDIGADSPQEIALSILAEIRTVLSGRSGGFLRQREGPINDRP
ncbi:MAG TPA: XdhC/CoxI family protein [Acidobacteriota bacterium]|nr:XdhC/CoxI family protein [Acidobacteriota bacterium]